jgi:hypothetical protein
MYGSILVQYSFWENISIGKRWTGTGRMIALCRKHGIPVPEFSAHPDWFSVRSTKNMYPDVWLLVLGLSGSQVKALRNADE